MYRDMQNALLAGVCSGLAKTYGLTPLGVRLIFAVGFWFFGLTLLVYVVLALTMKQREQFGHEGTQN